jgi:hypothetical protein
MFKTVAVVVAAFGVAGYATKPTDDSFRDWFKVWVAKKNDLASSKQNVSGLLKSALGKLAGNLANAVSDVTIRDYLVFKIAEVKYKIEDGKADPLLFVGVANTWYEFQVPEEMKKLQQEAANIGKAKTV